MTRTIYRDADHPRARTGRFTAKTNDAPVGSLEGELSESRQSGSPATPVGVFTAGERVLFTFAGQDEEAATFDGQTVEIVRPLDPSDPSDNLDAEVGPMYRVQTDDGQTFDVFADELSRADDDGETKPNAPAEKAEPGRGASRPESGHPAPRRWDALDKGIQAAWDQADREVNETFRTAAGIFD